MGVGREHPGEGSGEALFTVLVMIAGDEFEYIADSMVVQIFHNFYGVGLYGLKSLNFGFCLLVTKQEVCSALLFRDRL